MEAPRSVRVGRSVKIRTEHRYQHESLINNTRTESNVNLKEMLLQMCSREVTNMTKPHLASLLNVISKQLETGDCCSIGVPLRDLFICLQIPLLNENKGVRAAGLRVIRLCIKNEECVKILVETHLHHFIAKCLDVIVDNMSERAQALRLCRKMLLINPPIFPSALGRSIVALAIDGSKEKDRLVRASLALLSELCVLNPSVFVSSGGIRCFVSAVLDCPSSRMQEAMVASLLFLLNTEKQRKMSGLNLQFLVAPYSDFHYKHSTDTGDSNANNAGSLKDDRELRLTCAKQALLSVLRSWPGLLHVISCNIFHDLVQVLLPCHLETRKAMLELFYTLLRLPLPEWTDEFTVALQATDPSRVQDAWKLQEGYIAMEGKCLLPHVSKFRPNLVLNHTALLVYCLVESGLVQTLIEVLVTSDTFISVRATILLGELLHLSSTLLPPACHGTKTCLPKLIDYITQFKSDPVKRHRAIQAATALSKIHQLKKKGVVAHSLALKQIVELEKRNNPTQDATTNGRERIDDNQGNGNETRSSGDFDCELRSSRDPDGVLFSLQRDCGVLAQKDPLLWNWHVLYNIFMWAKMNMYVLEDSTLRSIVRRLVQFYKPSSNQFCPCEFNNRRTRLYTVVGCLLFDFLTVVEEAECEKILSEFLEDLSTSVRSISSAPSAHDSLLSPGRLSTTVCQDYFLFLGRLSSNSIGITALEKAGIFQDLLELVNGINHDCYLKVIVSTLNYHTDGYARVILKKVLNGPVESGRIYATNHMRVLLRAAVAENLSAHFAKWALPLLINQLKNSCRAVVMAAVDILDEATDDPACIEVLIPLHSQLNQIVEEQEQHHLGPRGRLLLIKTLSTTSGFKMWLEDGCLSKDAGTNLIHEELERWIKYFNIRYVQIVESDLADRLTHHQRAEDGRYGRVSNVSHTIRDLPIPAHLFSQLNQHRDGLDFLRTSGQLSKLFTIIANCSVDSEEDILELKAAIWAAGHLGTSEAGVSLLESSLVVESFIRIASDSSVLALRGTAFFALNLVSTTATGVDILSRLGWSSIKRHHGELWHVIDDSEWVTCIDEMNNGCRERLPSVPGRERLRTTSQSSSLSVTFAADFAANITEKGGVIVASTPIRPGASTTSWDSDSQPYSLQGSSINFDSDSDLSVQDTDRNRRAYTLPPNIHSATDYVSHLRSFSDSHYPAATEETSTIGHNSRRPSMDTRIWNKLRSSFRLRKSKRFSLPARPWKRESAAPPAASSVSKPIEMVNLESCNRTESAKSVENQLSSNDDDDDDEDDDNGDEEEEEPAALGSVLSRLKWAPSKKRPINCRSNAPVYIGLCLPVKLSSFYPKKELFDLLLDDSSAHSSTIVGDDVQFDHQVPYCVLCSNKMYLDATVESKESNEERALVRKELLRLVFSMGSSVGLNSNEQGLLRLKQRFSWAFHDVCLFSDVCHVLASYTYRLRARRFLHELFMDSPFQELFTEAAARLRNSDQRDNATSAVGS